MSEAPYAKSAFKQLAQKLDDLRAEIGRADAACAREKYLVGRDALDDLYEAIRNIKDVSV